MCIRDRRQGRALATELQSGAKTCADLTREEFDHIGEFVMGRMVGSIADHEAMNTRMTAVMGSEAEARMHGLLGARFAACATSNGNSTGAYGPMMGSGSRSWSQGDWSAMMGDRGWGSMMRSGAWTQMMGSPRDWNWMTGSRWRHMSTADWSAVEQRMLGTTTPRHSSSGWDVRDLVLLAVALGLAAGLLGLLLARGPQSRVRA